MVVLSCILYKTECIYIHSWEESRFFGSEDMSKIGPAIRVTEIVLANAQTVFISHLHEGRNLGPKPWNNQPASSITKKEKSRSTLERALIV